MWPARLCASRRRALALTAGLVLSRCLAAAPACLYGRGLQFVDDVGRRRSLDEWRGRSVIITMAYGACRRVCSTSLRTLERLAASARAAAVPLQFVVVGLDPANDTPRDWAQYRRDHGLNGTEWTFLCGSAGATRALADFLGVRYWSMDDHILHDFKIVRLTPDGQLGASASWADDAIDRLLIP